MPLRSKRAEDKRRHVRVVVHMTVCVRHGFLGEDLVSTEDVSRGGFRFKSRKRYSVGAQLSVAVPFAPGGANIFVPARIAHVRELLGDNTFVYGVTYIPVLKSPELGF